MFDCINSSNHRREKNNNQVKNGEELLINVRSGGVARYSFFFFAFRDILGSAKTYLETSM